MFFFFFCWFFVANPGPNLAKDLKLSLYISNVIFNEVHHWLSNIMLIHLYFLM